MASPSGVGAPSSSGARMAGPSLALAGAIVVAGKGSGSGKLLFCRSSIGFGGDAARLPSAKGKQFVVVLDPYGSIGATVGSWNFPSSWWRPSCGRAAAATTAPAPRPLPGVVRGKSSATSFALGSAPVPWRKVCGGGPVLPRNALHFISPSDLNDELVVVIEESEIWANGDKWRCSFVGYVMRVKPYSMLLPCELGALAA